MNVFKIVLDLFLKIADIFHISYALSLLLFFNSFIVV